MCQIMMRSTSFEEEEETSDEEQQEHTSPIHADEEETAEQSSSEDEEEEIMLAEDDDLLTQQNNNQHHPNEEEEEEDLNQQEEAAPIIEEEQEDEDSDSTKLSSPVISTHHNNQHNTSTANSSSGAAEESIQIDEDDLETLRRDDHMENGLLECDEEMDYLLNDEKIMMPQTPLLINNDNFTTPNSAGSVTVAMPFLDDVDGCVESKPLNENEIECKLECNIVTTEEVSEKENVELATESSVLQMNQPIAHNSESLIENRQTISIADEQMNVLVMEDDQIVVNQEVIEKPSLIQQQETQPNNTDIISSINLDEDLDIEMINDFLQSEKGADLCEEHSKENSPHGDSISNQSMNDSWNTNYTTDSLGSTMHHRQPMQGCTPLISRKNFNHHAQSIPLEDLLQNYDHRIEYSTLEMLIKELEGIGVYTVNSLPLVPKKHIMALPGMDDRLYENLMDSAQSLDPSQSFGFSTATQFLHEFHTKRYKVTTGCTAFDELIGGGFESSSVSELFGESSCGKTQVCFTLCLTAQLPLTEDGPSGKVLYVDTMGTFNPSRIQSIAERFSKDDERMTTLFMNNILKERIYTSDQLFSNLNRITTLLKSNKGKPFKLIIVDSAVSVFRSEYKGKDEINIRQQYLLKYLDSLNKLAEQFNIAIVITNQVMDTFDKPLMYSPYKQNTSSTIKPVGGHIMGHTIPTRIQLCREKQKRIAKVFKSSTRPEGVCNFSIQATGITDYEDVD